MVRREITLQIRMIDEGRELGENYFMALQEEAMLRIHKSLAYEYWR